MLYINLQVKRFGNKTFAQEFLKSLTKDLEKSLNSFKNIFFTWCYFQLRIFEEAKQKFLN